MKNEGMGKNRNEGKGKEEKGGKKRKMVREGERSVGVNWKRK